MEALSRVTPAERPPQGKANWIHTLKCFSFPLGLQLNLHKVRAKCCNLLSFQGGFYFLGLLRK